VCYSLGMETLTAPDFSRGYPSKGARLGPAWTEVFNALASTPGEWRDGTALWTEVAENHGLSAVTVRGLMFRAASLGLLESERRKMDTGKGIRTRTHFRYVKKG
jgi:hypothetical protein